MKREVHLNVLNLKIIQYLVLLPLLANDNTNEIKGKLSVLRESTILGLLLNTLKLLLNALFNIIKLKIYLHTLKSC